MTVYDEPGIPSMKDFATIPTRGERMANISIQEHQAERAGKHYDLRLVLNGRTASSWACRYWPLTSGEKRLAIRQPEHSKEYMRFSGTIPEGRGKGTVKLELFGNVKIISSKPNTVKFSILSGRFKGNYTLRGTSKTNWLLMNITLSNKGGVGATIKPVREKYKEVKLLEEKVKRYIKGDYILQPKIDGAHNLVVLDAGKYPNIISYRISKKTGDFINHTHKFSSLTSIKVPKSIKNTILRAEVFGKTKKGKIIEPSKLGGYLNSSNEKALDSLGRDKIKLTFKAFDIDKYNGRSVRNLSYEARLQLLNKIRDKMPTISIMSNSNTEIAKRKLVDMVISGKHPETKEGIVAWPKGHGRPIKIKLRPDYDVYIRKIFKGVEGSKYEKSAGGFWYSWTSSGRLVGKVGTGFTDYQRKDMKNSSHKWVGRVAVLEAHEKLPSGALREPSFKRLHLEK